MAEVLEKRTLLTAGMLDPLFADAGRLFSGFTGTADLIYDMRVQPDGRILVAGQTGTNGGDFAIARYTPEGALDASFGDRGKVVVDIASGSLDVARALALQADGKILVGGESNARTGADADFAILRLNADGSIDREYGSQGIVLTDFGGKDVITAMAIMDDSRLIAVGATDVAGAASRSDFALARYLPTGKLDPSFDSVEQDGKVTTDIVGAHDEARAIILQPDGKIVVGGQGEHRTQSGWWWSGKVVRYNEDGSLDAGFATGGKADAYPVRNIFSLGLQDNGRIIYGGSANTSHAILGSLRSNGSADVTFGTNGQVSVGLGFLVDLAIAADGKVVTVARWGDDTLQVSRSLRDGTLDPTFGTAGLTRSSLGVFVQSGPIALSPDGSILAAAQITAGGFAVLRYDGYSAPNILPISNAGGPYTVFEDAQIILDGTASKDPDGRIRLYEWDFDYDGVNFDVDAVGSKPLFSGMGLDGPATRTIALRVTDSQDVQVIGTAVLHIADTPPVLSMSGAAWTTDGTTYTLTLSATPVGPDTITSWTIDWGDGSIETVPADTRTLTHVFADSPGNYVIRGWATDEDGMHPVNNGTLDPTFASGTADFDHYESAVAISYSPLGDRIYTVSDKHFRVVAYKPDGSLDGSFGNNGMAFTDFGISSESHTSTSVAVQPDGKILVTGDWGTYYIAVVRYLPDGTRDPSFGTDGRIKDSIAGARVSIRAITVQPDGKIIVAGTSTPYGANPQSFTLIRYTADGRRDSSFGVGGRVPMDAGSGAVLDVCDIAVQPDGKIVAAGRIGSYFGLTRYNSDGSLDLSFGTGGTVAPDEFAGYKAELSSLVLQPDGKLVAIGSHTNNYATYPRSAAILAMRFNTDGSRDIAFGQGGTSIVSVTPTVDTARDAVWHNGALFITGTSSLGPNSSGQYLLLKLKSDGIPDEAFGRNGALTAMFSAKPSQGMGLAGHHGTIVIVGSTTTVVPPQDLAIARYNVGPLVVRENDTPAVANLVFSADAIDEGQTLSISGTIVDPDVLDRHAVRIDWGDGSFPTELILLAGEYSFQASHRYVNDNPSGTASDTNVVTITVRDGIAAGSIARDLLVRNLPPTIDVGPDQTVNEGTRVFFTAVASDPGTADTLGYRWRVIASNGQVIPDSTASSFNFIPTDNGTYQVSCTVTDDDGGQATDTAMITVNNVAPQALAGGNKVVQEGKPVSITAQYVDPGSADTHTFLWRIVASNGQVVPDQTTRTLSFTPIDNGTYTLTLTVWDDDGGVGTDQAILTVQEVAPTLSLSAPKFVFEGQQVSISFSATDPGDDTIVEWRIEWGDGQTEILPAAARSASRLYAGPGVYSLRLWATDEDGTYSTTATVIMGREPVLTAAGQLQVFGTPAADTVGISTANGTVVVSLHSVSRTFPAASVQDLSIILDAGNDTLTLTGMGVGGNVDLGTGNDTITIDGGADVLFTVAGGDGSDSAIITDSARGSISFNGGGSSDSLTFHGTTGSDTIIIDATSIRDGARTITFGAVESLVVRSGGGDDSITLSQNLMGAGSVTIYGGAGNDQITISAVPNNIYVSVFGDEGDDTFMVGPGARGSLVFNGNAGTDTLIIQGTDGRDNFTIGTNTISSTVWNASFTLVERLVLDCAGGDDTVIAPPPLATGPQITVNGGEGRDQLRISGASSAYTLRITADAITVGSASLNYSGMEDMSVVGSSGNDTFNVVDLPAGATVAIDAGGGADTFNITGGHRAARLSLIGGSGNDIINYSPAVDVPVILSSAETGVDTLNINTGTFIFSSSVNALPTYSVVVKAGASVVFSGQTQLASLKLEAASTARLSAGQNGVIHSKALTIAPDARLDVSSGELLVQATAATRQAVLNSILTLVRSGRGGATGPWTGYGLASGAAAADPRTGLAPILNDRGDGKPMWTSLYGLGVDIHTIRVKHTWNGDTNLDGRVDAADFFAMDRGFLLGGAGYANGDLDLDHDVDGDDFFLADAAFLMQSIPLVPSSSDPPGSAPAWQSSIAMAFNLIRPIAAADVFRVPRMPAARASAPMPSAAPAANDVMEMSWKAWDDACGTRHSHILTYTGR